MSFLQLWTVYHVSPNGATTEIDQFFNRSHAITCARGHRRRVSAGTTEVREVEIKLNGLRVATAAEIFKPEPRWTLTTLTVKGGAR